MQPWIIGQALARFQAGFQPFDRWIVAAVPAFEQVAIHLLLKLQGVAAIAPHRSRIAQHDGETGRAGESGQPGQSLGAQGDVFALVFIGEWNDEAGEVLPGQFRPQVAQPLRCRAAVVEAGGKTRRQFLHHRLGTGGRKRQGGWQQRDARKTVEDFRGSGNAAQGVGLVGGQGGQVILMQGHAIKPRVSRCRINRIMRLPGAEAYR